MAKKKNSSIKATGKKITSVKSYKRHQKGKKELQDVKAHKRHSQIKYTPEALKNLHSSRPAKNRKVDEKKKAKEITPRRWVKTTGSAGDLHWLDSPKKKKGKKK